MKSIKLPPKAIRDYIEFRNGDVFALPNMPAELRAQFYIYKLEWKMHKIISK
jgi:hypothetical protein